MGRCNLNFTFISFHLLLLSLFICTLTVSSTQFMPDPIQDFLCGQTNCGNGKCKVSNATLLGFDCECDPGWKKIQIGALTFPSCLVPNCTIDFQCGNGSPPPPPPPAPPLPPLPPCAFVWCGDGNCVANNNGTGYTCQCNEDSANLFNLTGLACFKECYFGADCKGFGLGFGQNKVPPPPPPPPSTSGSTGNGSNEVPNCSRNLHALTMILLAAIFLTWV